MNLNHLNITLASDENYAEFVGVVIVSLLTNNKWAERITVHLLSNGISDTTLSKLKTLMPAERGELSVYPIDNLQSRLGIKVPNTIAITSYARLFLPQLLPNDVERVLYVDCDTVVADSVQSLYQTSLTDDDWVAGVLDTLPDDEAKVKIGIKSGASYFNAGVLLINLAAWREFDVTSRCLNFLLAHNGTVHHHDQGIINAVCDGHKVTVHPRFNATSNYYSHPYRLLLSTNEPFYTEQEFLEARESPAILHFTEGFYNRPWIANSLHPLREVWHKYHRLTPWSTSSLRPDHRSAAVKLLSWTFLNLPYGCYKVLSRIISLLGSIKK